MHAKRTLDVELQRGEEVIPQPLPLAQAAVNDLGCFPSVPYNASFLASIQPQLPYSTQKRNFIFVFMIHKPYVLSKAGVAVFTCLVLPSPTPASMREWGHSGLQD